MKTKDLNIEKKLIEVDLKNEFSYLLKESEGYLQGWMLPKYINWDGLTNDELVKILILYPWAVDYCDLKKFTDDNFKNILKGLDSRLKNK